MLNLIRNALIGAAFVAALPPVPQTVPPTAPRIAKLLAKSDGTTRETAWKVRNVAEEYQIVRALGLEARKQSLIVDKGRAYDMIEASDQSTGQTRELWFDITSFYGRMF